MSRSCLALICASLAQAGIVHPGAPTARSLRTWSERALAFFDAWVQAEGERRAATERALDELATPGAPLDRRPSLAELALLARVLRGSELASARADELACFADALDLRLVPGAFLAHDASTRGESLVAFVQRLGPPRLSGDLELSLRWIDPQGNESEARTEPFGATVFDNEVPFFFPSPPGAPGSWTLVPELCRGDRRVRGAAVPIRGLEAAAIQRADSGADERLARLRKSGERELETDDIDRATRAGELAGTLSTMIRGALLFLAPQGEDPDLVLSGVLGARWRELARRRGLRLASIPQDPRGTTRLTPEIERLRSSGAARVILVARADAAVYLHRLVAQETLAIDGLILCTSLPEPGSSLPSVPTLLVHTAPSSSASSERVTHVQGARSAFLEEPALPAHVDAWIGSTLEPPR